MPKLSATDWLKEEIYRSETFGLTRFDVLKTIRNKEGVGHFDAKINQASGYSALRNAGHEDCYWRRCKDRGCIALFIFGTPFYSVAVAPPDGTPPPPLESKKHPLLGGVDGSVRTMAEELMCWLRSYGAIPAQKARDSQKLRTPFNNRLNVVRTSQPSDRQKPFAAKLGVIH
ncbi:hypothetical protein So717_17100 [Roseobacter cerasinus]|uniref:Uncharacterized protein n=2 Tax=Roseobacter cerasinus TaxID=2602289 RepID=A0A640VQD0_9RHOB|nr:hypothetical protein So717_17100 [Roseobacter cerasinus]